MLELTKALKAKCADLGQRYVPGAGNPSAKLWIVGEAPGEEEWKALQPFVGKSGGFLNACLRIAGINRENCYVDNVSPVRPPDNGFYRLEETGVQPGECIDAFRERVETFKPNVVLSLGATPLSALTSHEGIREWRGYILNHKGIKVVGSFHPSYILHKLNEKSAKKERENVGGIKYTYGTARMTLILDIMRAKEEAAYPAIIIPPRELHWDLEEEQSLEWLQKFSQEPELAADIETKGEYVDRISFGSLYDAVSFVLDCSARVKEFIARILKEHRGLVMQNGIFDMKLLKRAGMPVGRLRADTLLAHNLLYPEWPHGLDYLASIYEKLTYPPHGPGWDMKDQIGKSNALHSFLTLSIWKKLEKELKEIEDQSLQ